MDKSALESSLNTLDIWLIVFGILVAIGVAGESVVGFLHWRRSGELQGLQTSENLVLQHDIETLAFDAEAAKGEIAEANARAAEANRKAAEAALALEKYKAPRTINPEGITKAASPFAKTEFDVAVGPMGDPEPEVLATAIASALTKAGWLQIPWKTSDGQLTLEKPGKPTYGFAAVTNVIVDIHPGQATRLWPIARAVAAALIAEGIAAEAQQGSGGRNTNESAIHIMIGRKM